MKVNFIPTLCAVIVTISSLLFGGCSTAIYKNGKYADILSGSSTRGDIRSELGSPLRSGLLQDEHRILRWLNTMSFDEFIGYGPIFDRHQYMGSSMGTAMTFGLLEPIEIPNAIGWKLNGRKPRLIQVLYDEDDQYQWRFVREL
ncbi:MAG: hypothetical protein AAF226_15825 [Verrucomicrobiota bacterium]